MSKKDKRHAVVCFSGGLDSSTCLGIAKKKHGRKRVHALTFDYGQRNGREVDMAAIIAREMKVKMDLVNLRPIFSGDNGELVEFSNNSMINWSIPIKNGSQMVPFRNGVFLSVAVQFAMEIDADFVYFGAAGIEPLYADVSADFLWTFSNAAYAGTKGKVLIEYPLLGKTDEWIVRTAIETGVPLEYTWSCLDSGDKPCGTCPSCIRRKIAFNGVGIEDPALDMALWGDDAADNDDDDDEDGDEF